MHTTKTAEPTVGRDRLLALLLIVALGTLLMAGLSACGSDTATDATGSDPTPVETESGDGTVAGSYSVKTTSEEGMDAFTLTLKDDGTFALTQPDPDTGKEVGIGGTYTIAGDKLSLTNDEGSESDAGTIDGDQLVFETITWVKQ